MRSTRRDRLGLAMLGGALIGFVIGAAIGFGSSALDTPVIAPFVGAAIGVVVAALVVSVMGISAARERGRVQASRREMAHQRMRSEAHRGWVEGVDLGAELSRRRPRRP